MRVPLIISIGLALSACGRSDLAPLVVEASDAPDDTLTAVDSAIDSRPAPPRCSGTWSFAPSVGYFTGAKYAQVPAGIAVGDFNHDGALDIAAVNYDNSIGILINAGNGTFDRPVTYAMAAVTPQAEAIAVGDFNGDGSLDVAASCGGYPGNVGVFFNAGDGTFGAESVTHATGGGSGMVAVGDFNRDGAPDLAVTNSIDDTVSVLINDGNGTFAAQVIYAVGTGAAGDAYSLAVADFNGDGFDDLVVVGGGTSVSVFFNRGDGTFSPQVTYAPPAGRVIVADFNADGRPDLGLADVNGQASAGVWLNAGHGVFAPQPVTAINPQAWGFGVGDFNGDGRLDLATSSDEDPTASLLLGVGDGSFAPQLTYSVGTWNESLAVADFNGDGLADLAVSNATGFPPDLPSLYLFLSQCK